MHEEYIRLHPSADTAVLFIHGICGTPDHFRRLIGLEKLVPEHWSVYNLLLDGHGGSPRDFAATSREKWENQVQQAYTILTENHQHILIVGHSMGTLFALQLAVAHPDIVKKLFLLAVPMRPRLKLSLVADLLLMVLGKLEDAPEHRIALVRAAGIRTTWKLWEYIPWMPRFLDLFRIIGQTEKVIPCVSADCRCYQSQKDELVWPGSEKVLKRNEKFRIIRLEDSSHFYYAPADRVRLTEDFQKWIKNPTAE